MNLKGVGKAGCPANAIKIRSCFQNELSKALSKESSIVPVG